MLAIWSTIAAESETDYMHWLTREHIFERVSVPGFRSGRVFKRRNSRPSEYMMLYELDNADVMSSPGYLERLNNPTPWTQRIMPTLEQFRRGGGSIVARGGNPAGHGGHISIARFEDALPDRLAAREGLELVKALAKVDWVVSAQIMSVKNDATAIATQEKSMRRSSEGEFAGLLLVESLDTGSLDRAIAQASESAGIEPDTFDSYDLVFVCHSR
ncbi:DUF4286 family protein [Paraburkholderia sp. BL9I2N2]|uniref:DUF4286 family protein n=1 Tax=Paraburkholderia sp. BL9I2N2 TaxID=1938809 RepID=UPI001FB46000|nr:DUF4286 family protein [Paraburkholderia sp. BL9I2N2]